MVLNVTVASATASGYVSVFPSGDPAPTVSNLNYVPGEIVPNLVMVKIGAGKKVSFFNYAGSTDLVADVVGWFTAPS